MKIKGNGGLNIFKKFRRTQASSRLDDLAQRITPLATWDDLILPEQQKSSLQEIAMHVRQHSKVYKERRFAAKSSRGLGISALFTGESGTGKTMACEALANELNLDLYRVDLSQVVSKYIGETEKNLDRIFAATEAKDWIFFFDEADALFGKRTEVKDSHDRYANAEVSYLLQRMETYRGLAIMEPISKTRWINHFFAIFVLLSISLSGMKLNGKKSGSGYFPKKTLK